MPTIDADAHVIETEQTWAYMDEPDERFAPLLLTQRSGTARLGNQGNAMKEYFSVENRLHTIQSNVGMETPEESREMRNVAARLKHMDELEIDVQVLYPTFFLRPVTRNPQIELALSTSYNRWMADIWSRSDDRLRWVAVPPLYSMDRVEDELAFAKDHGACGIYMRGLECERSMWNPYFFPLYELAGRMDLPVCMHSANGSFAHHDFFADDSGFNKFKLAVVGEFHALLMADVPARFPDVRWAFIEVSAQWIPYVLNDLELRLKRNGRRLPASPLKDNNIFVACQVTDDLRYIVDYAGEDNLVIGTDYGHHDTSAQIEALRLIRDNGKVPGAVVDKILGPNAATLYGLPA